MSFINPPSRCELTADILLIVPPAYHAPISNHLNENFTASTHPRARIELKRHTDGEKDDEEDKGEGGSGDYAGGMDPGGTARLLRRFKNHIKVSKLNHNQKMEMCRAEADDGSPISFFCLAILHLLRVCLWTRYWINTVALRRLSSLLYSMRQPSPSKKVRYPLICIH